MGKLYLYLISILWIVVGVLLVFATDLIRGFYKKLFEKADLKKWSPLPIVLSILLLLASPYNSYRVFVIILGIIGIAKGVSMIVATDKMKEITNWWLNKATNATLKFWGVITVIMGTFVLMGIKV